MNILKNEQLHNEMMMNLNNDINLKNGEFKFAANERILVSSEEEMQCVGLLDSASWHLATGNVF